MKYAYVMEKSANGYSSYVPDLPGCVAASDTETETQALIEEAIEFPIEGLRLGGFPMPEPTTLIGYAEVA